MASETVWTFDTARFQVRLEIEPDYSYQYDGDDEDGATQAALDAGDYVALDSDVIVTLDGIEIARTSLGGSVYDASDVASFWSAHRGADPMDRNCSVMRAARGNCSICHYFPGMVSEAIAEARKAIASMPAMRAA